MPNIETIEKDIVEVLRGGHRLPVEVLSKFGANVAMKLERQLKRDKAPRESGVIRASEIGMVDTCAHKLWYSYHTPTVAEELGGTAIFKFLYGDIIEEATLTLARAAGHLVECEQQKIEISYRGYLIRGSIDAVVDGVLVDVKSTTQYGIKEFVAGRGGDKFGYRAQLNVYAAGMGAERKGWIAVDKTIGTIKWAEETRPYDVDKLLDKAVDTIESRSEPKSRLLPTIESNGNASLSTECNYCPYKRECWKDANGGKGLRTFAYSTGHKHLVHVAALPKVAEVVCGS